MLGSSQSVSLPWLNPVNRFIRSIYSYNGNVMLGAFISLLVVIIFILILHIYAKWFFSHVRRRQRSSVIVSQVLGQARPHRFHSLSTSDHTLNLPASSPTKGGLDVSVISTIPLFIYVSDNQSKSDQLECVICISSFEENEIGRCMPMCRHVFHIDCIDMWLKSHSNCPICRAPVFHQIPLCNDYSENRTVYNLQQV